MAEAAAIEEHAKSFREPLKEVDKRIMDKREERRELEDGIGRLIKKLNSDLARIFGNVPAPQLRFDPEKSSADQMLVCVSSSTNMSCEQLDESISATLKSKKEELARRESALAQTKDELKSRSRTAEDALKSNGFLTQQVMLKRKRLEEIAAAARETEETQRKELQKVEEALAKVTAATEDSGKEIAALQEQFQQRRAYQAALIEQRKKDGEETRQMAKEFATEVAGQKAEMAGFFDQFAGIIHNVNLQLRQQDNDATCVSGKAD